MAQASACAAAIAQACYGAIVLASGNFWDKELPMPYHWFGILAALVSATAQFVLFLRWLHRRMRNDEIVRAFVRDIATNHLPHIYSALREIAQGQGIDLHEPPLVRFVDLHGHRRND